jgi:4-hydroxy-tetrahydrodipicolinate synthase
MNQGKVDWKGCLVAVVTPFTEAGDLDEKAFCENLERLEAEGAHGFIISGCTGEAWAITHDERARLFALSVDTMGKRLPIIAGTGGIATSDVIQLSRRAKELGTDGLMILPPYYCMAKRAEVISHYAAISDAVQHPIMLYNIPRRTGFNLTPDVVAELVQLEWIVAIKESSNDFIQTEDTIREVGEQMIVVTGHSAERGVPALLMGAKGYVSSMESQIMGRRAIQMYDLVQQSRIGEARDVQLQTLELDHRMRQIGTFPANLKAAMNLLGRNGGVPRPPLLPLGSGQMEEVRRVLERLKLLTTAA